MEHRKGEREFETGMDEQYKQAGANRASESVFSHARDNDRSSDYYETLKYRSMSLDLAEREHNLTISKNREYTVHLANLKANDHYGYGYDRLVNMEPREAKAVSEMLHQPALDAIRALVVSAVAEGLKK